MSWGWLSVFSGAILFTLIYFACCLKEILEELKDYDEEYEKWRGGNG